MKLALVDGALGHSGSFLIKLLLEKGWKVVATDLKDEHRKELMTKETIFGNNKERLECRDWKNVTYIPADLTKKSTLLSLFSKNNFSEDKKNYDVIFHTASLYDYNAPYELLHKINYEGLQNLLQVLSDYTEESKTPFPRFIHWSTCGVYGEPNYPKDEKGFIYPVNEDTPFNPPNDYSKTKVEQEKLLINFSEKNEKFYYNILRPAPIYGPYQTYGMYHIFYSSYTTGHMIVAKIFPKRKKLFMPFIHVKDLAKAALFIAECEEGTSQVFNIINDSILQEDWEEFLYNELGISFSTVPIPWFLFKIIANFELVIAKFKAKRAKKRGYRPKFDIPMVEYLTHQYYFSNKKLKDLGFEFEYNDFKKGIKETVRWYKDNKWFPSFEPLEFLQNKILKNQEEAI